jgi:hypothetical protein
MTLRVIVLALFLFALAVPLRAEDVPLTPGEAPAFPGTIYNFEPLEEGEGWEDGKTFLTANARSAQAFFPVGDLEDEGLLLSVDTCAEGARRPDTLYIDLNGNGSLDEGEKFPLEPAGIDHATPDNPLAIVFAKKIPLPATGGEEPLLVNIFYTPVPVNVLEYAPLLLGIQAWECRRGTVTLDGKGYDVVLKDMNVNGAFDDFESGDGSACDTLSLIPAGKELAFGFDPYEQPLRPRFFIEAGAYSVSTGPAGEKLALEKLDTVFGAVAAAAGDIEMTLTHPEWGAHTVKAGQERSFPAGTWKVKTFRRVREASGAYCSYSGPEGMTVAIGPGKKAAVGLDTALKGSVEAQRSRDQIVLSLDMATPQGAHFEAYANPAAKKPFKGVPFTISDGSGRTVLEAVFKFG